MTFDYLIVGAGLAGATFAHLATKAGKKCQIIDRRPHVAGNCYTEEVEGIDVHRYGPHLFHTNNERVWKFVNQFAHFNDYHHTVLASTVTGLHSLPINMHTFNSVLGIQRPIDAEYYLKKAAHEADETNIEGWCFANIGRTLYETFIRDYTIKQWGVHPRELPSSIIKRLPVRTTFDNRYFTDTYQGIPKDGYTNMILNMSAGCPILTHADFIKNQARFKEYAPKIVYTGALDELYDYDLGKLPYRSIKLETEVLDMPNYQGIGQINHTSMKEEYTRTIEHKHFNPDKKSNRTVVSREYSTSNGEPYYPINTSDNNTLSDKYKERARKDGYIICGRMANYQYYNMDQVIAQSMKTAEEELNVQFA